MRSEDLFFELSHPKRSAILVLLRQQPLRLSPLAERTGISPPEVTRHLHRLARLGLIERRAEHVTALTGYGRVVSEFLPSFEFLVRHHEFLREHDLSGLPRQFLHRLDELAEPEVGEDVADTMRHLDAVLGEAREFAWLMGSIPVLPEEAIVREARRAAITVRIIVPPRLVPPGPRRRRHDPPFDRIEVRTLPEIPMGIAMNEQLAGIGVPDRRGRIDLTTGMRGRSVPFRQWCRDLFEHYWAIARPLR
ncbi:MAG: ArsR family transcriptional regulator [Thermoplasmata archaeon]